MATTTSETAPEVVSKAAPEAVPEAVSEPVPDTESKPEPPHEEKAAEEPAAEKSAAEKPVPAASTPAPGSEVKRKPVPGTGAAPDAAAAPAKLAPPAELKPEAAEKPAEKPAAPETETSKAADGGAPAPTAVPVTGEKVSESKAALAVPAATSNASSAAERDETNPPDFAGEVETNNELPTQATLKKLENHTVLDADGRSHTFKSLYSGKNVPRRVLIIFIRHFFCGNCQEYLRTLSASITPESLLRLPVSTFIAVIGCGASELINSYIAETGCPFPVYADETQKLYKELGMVKTWNAGSRPAYMQNKTLGHTVVSGIMQGLRQVKTGLVLRMGDQRQVGGEFLFEPATASFDSPIATPRDEIEPDPDAPNAATSGSPAEEKRVTWCHRMRTTRDHAEVPELMEVLGLDGEGQPIGNQKRWEKALRERKGTGLSMASQMSGRRSMDSTGKNGPQQNGNGNTNGHTNGATPAPTAV